VYVGPDRRAFLQFGRACWLATGRQTTSSHLRCRHSNHWSGARDLNPEPHGPEPCWLHVLECPGGSADARLNSNRRTLMSVRVLLEPPGAGNL